MILKASRLHYVRGFDNGAKHELIGRFRTREQAQTEAPNGLRASNRNLSNSFACHGRRFSSV
jgi:hypothetical protein